MAPNYEVVISGVSGRFPKCDSYEDLESNLFSGINMIGKNSSRWEPGLFGVCPHIGRMNVDADKTFFSVTERLNKTYSSRIPVNIAYETICDAGINPEELYNSKTAVIMTNPSGSERLGCDITSSEAGDVLSYSLCFTSNKISYHFNFTGPSYTLATTPTDGAAALYLAHKLVANGDCDQVLVGGINVVLDPRYIYHVEGMSKLTHDNKTKSFSAEADGFNPSESISMFLLQRSNVARRSYGTIQQVMTRYLGSRKNKLSDFDDQSFSSLLEEAYKQSSINPSCLTYIEAHGLGIKNIDAKELNTTAHFMCKKRQNPLLVGSVTSNLGHTGATSLFSSLAKAIIIFKTGKIPGNLHFTNPNPAIPALISGDLKVVVESTPFEGDYIGINFIGLFGELAHVIVKRDPWFKTEVPKLLSLPSDKLPRLVNISGRDEYKLDQALKKIMGKPIKAEFVALLHTIFRIDIYKHFYRGFVVLDEQIKMTKEIMPYEGGVKRPVWFVFSGMGSQWPGMGIELMKFPIFAKAIYKCQEVLKPFGVDVIHIITTREEAIFNNILNCFVGIAAVQIGLVDLLKGLKINPQGIIGHSVGEFGCGYADGCLTSEEIILASYYRGRASLEAQVPQGMMAAVGIGYNAIKDILPPSIDVACHNAKDSCTLSGPTIEVEKLVKELQQQGKFAKLVSAGNIPYHSRYIGPIGSIMLNYLKEVIKEPKPRSEKWVCSSLPESEWGTDLARYCSAEYSTNNLLNPVYFEEASKHIPPNAICIEIAPHGLLQAILRRSLGNQVTNISLTNRGAQRGVTHFLTALGRLYNNGVDMDLTVLYPEVAYPITNCDYIHNLITWSLSDPEETTMKPTIQSSKSLALNWPGIYPYKYCDHKIHGRIIVSSAKLIESIVYFMKEIYMKKEIVEIIAFENVKIFEYEKITPENNVVLEINILPSSGKFEVLSNSSLKMVGQVNLLEEKRNLPLYAVDEKNIFTTIFDKDEIYLFLKNLGLEYGKALQNISSFSLTSTGCKCSIIWVGKLDVFLESLISIKIIIDSLQSEELHILDRINSLYIEPSLFNNKPGTEIKIVYDFSTGIIDGPAIKMLHPRTRTCEISSPSACFENYRFIPYSQQQRTPEEYLMEITQLINENVINSRNFSQTSFIEILTNPASPLQNFKSFLHKQLLKDIPFISLAEYFSNSSNYTEGRVVIIADNLNDPLKEILARVRQGILLVSSELNNEILEKCQLIPILNKSNIFYVYKKVPKFNFVSQVIQSNVNTWETLLKHKLDNDLDGGRIFMVIRVTSISEIRQVLQRIHNYQGHELRFVFIDEKQETFDLSLPHYQSHLAKDLKINICIDGNWGSLIPNRLPCVWDDSDKQSTLTNVKVATIFENTDNICTLALNILDNPSISQIQHELVPFDCTYWERTQEWFGIASLTTRNNFTVDPILSWPIPPHWSNKEAVTVPSAYSTAYYVLSNLGSLDHVRSVLITEGHLPISQAILRVAYNQGCKTFTVCDTQQQCTFIKEAFPEFPEENIILYDENLAYNLKMRDGVNNITDIINTYKGQKRIKLMGILATEGKFIHLGLNENSSIGLNFFLKATSFKGININNLAKLNISTKQRINRAISGGIKTGVIKPLKEFTPPSIFVSKKDARAMKEICRNENLVIPKKSVRNFQMCHALFYVIVAGDNDIWFSLLKWIFPQKGKTVILVLQKALSTIQSYRLKALTSTSKDYNLEIVDGGMKKTKESSFSWMGKISFCKSILFYTSEDVTQLKDISNNLNQKEYSQCGLICIGNHTGGLICEERWQSGFNALAINFDRQSSCNFSFRDIEEIIMSQFGKKCVINASKISEEENCLTPSEILPKNFLELETLHCETHLHFSGSVLTEFETRSCSWATSKDSPPVFIIPGINPHSLKELRSKLMYPSFMARIPVECNELETLAGQLLQALLEFKLKFYTIISADWGGALAFLLATLLEREGRKTVLILLDAVPCRIQTALKPMDSKVALKTYLHYACKVEEQSGYDKFINGICDIIWTRIVALSKFNESQPFSGICHFIKPQYPAYDLSTLEKYCSNEPNIHLIPADSFRDMLQSSLTVNLVNDLVLYDASDVVNPLNYYKYIDEIPDDKYDSKGLERID